MTDTRALVLEALELARALLAGGTMLAEEVASRFGAIDRRGSGTRSLMTVPESPVLRRVVVSGDDNGRAQAVTLDIADGSALDLAALEARFGSPAEAGVAGPGQILVFGWNEPIRIHASVERSEGVILTDHITVERAYPLASVPNASGGPNLSS